MSLYVHITSHSRDIIGLSSNSTEKQFGCEVKDNEVVTLSRRFNCESCGFPSETPRTVKQHDGGQSRRGTNKENRIPEEYSESERGASDESPENNYKRHKSGDVFTGKRDFGLRSEEHRECRKPREKCSDRSDPAWHSKARRGSGFYLICNSCSKIYHGDGKANAPEKLCDFCGGALTEAAHGVGDVTRSGGESADCSGTSVDGVFGTDAGSGPLDDDSYECDNCKECFPCKRDLLAHLRVHLKEQQTRKTRRRKCNLGAVAFEADAGGTSRAGKRKKRTAEKPYKCDEGNCQYATTQYSLLKSHKFKHNPFYHCVTCQEKFSSRIELKNHMSTHGERPFKCDQCSKSYKDKHGLGWHKKVQHDPSRLKFTCELCGKTYPFDSLLTQHINLTHAAEKQSVCDICGKNVSKTYLPMHRRTHGEKQYSCDVCEKTFLEKAYLKRHKMVHTGEKPYVCNVCGNSFRQHSTLTIHMRTHTGDRPYKCVLCDNAYKTHHNLKKHYKRSGHKLV